MTTGYSNGDRVRLTEDLVDLPKGTAGTIICSDEYKAAILFDNGERRILSFMPAAIEKISNEK